MKPGYICYDDVAGLGEVLWVDARTRVLWERNGLEGSVLLTDHASENWDDLMAEAGERLVMAEAVVVYCATEGCGSSEPVAGKIRASGLVIDPAQVKVLSGGFRTLTFKDASRRSQP